MSEVSEPDDRPPLLDVGRVVKPHGLRGELVVDLWSDIADRLDPGSVFSTDGGELVVDSTRAHQGRYLVLFDGVVDRTAAEALRGRVLRAEPVEGRGALWVDELIGAAVESVGGRSLGTVAAVETNPASDLLVLEDGGLIPLVFVVDRGPDGRVTVDIPDGLLD